jgi:hypothetical protein
MKLIISTTLASVAIPLILSFSSTVNANPYNSADIEVVAGNRHSCAFYKADGNAVCWGTDYQGTTEDYLDGDAIALEAGDYTNCVLKTDGNTQCWGWNSEKLSYTGGDAVQLSVGYGVACVLTNTGNVNCIGNELGSADSWISKYNGGDAEWVATSSYAACYKTSSATNLSCSGWNVQEPSWAVEGTPMLASGGHYAMCLKTTEGNVDCMNNSYNEVGQTAGYLGGDAIDASGQFDMGCVATSSGDVNCWGRKDDSINNTSWTPFTGVGAVSVAVSGRDNVCYSSNQGKVECTKDIPQAYEPVQQNTAPVADAGDNLRINAGQSFNLNGLGSYDLQTSTQELTYFWEVISGPENSLLTFDSANNINPVVNVNVLGTYEIRLTVTDPEGLSSTDSVLVSINGAPVANAGNDVATYVGSEVLLSSLNSTDPEGDYLAVLWNLVDKPVDSNYSLDESNLDAFSFTPLTEGTYTFELVVNDGLSVDSDTVSVTVISAASYAQQLLGDAMQVACNLDRNVLTTKGNGVALCQTIRQSISFVQKDKVAKAMSKIDFASARVNGCAVNGSVDTKRGSEMDYVTDCSVQQAIYSGLVQAKSLLAQ